MIQVEALPRDYTYGSTGVFEIMQNVRHILTTRKGTVPLHRSFGLSADLLDTPMPGIRARCEQEIFMELRKWEPRAVLKSIQWTADPLSGAVYPKVVIDIKDA